MRRVCLALLDSDAAYIGVIGSKRRWLTTVKALKEKGVAEEKIAQVHSPMGIGIERRNAGGDRGQHYG